MAGDKRAKAIFEIMEGKIPDPPSHIIFSKGIISIPLFPYLKAILNSKNSEARKAVIVTFGFIEEEENIVIPSLIKGLYDKNSKVCKAAATSLSQIKENITAVLIKELSSENPKVRTAVAWIIGKKGKDASLATDILIEKLNDPDDRVRKPVKWALEQIGFDIIPKILHKAETSEDPEILIILSSILGALKKILRKFPLFLLI